LNLFIGCSTGIPRFILFKINNIKKRITVTEALLHPYFYENPRPSLPEEIKILKKLDGLRKKNYEVGEKKVKK
jgi:hypothetical protein